MNALPRPLSKRVTLQLHAETDTSVLNIVKEKKVYKRVHFSSPKALKVFDCGAGCLVAHPASLTVL